MDLRWPLMLVPVTIAVIAVVLLAFLRSNYGAQGRLPYLARAFRITELPEYKQAIRRHNQLAAASLILLVVASLALLGATLRPIMTYSPEQRDSATPHVDIMLCFSPDFDVIDHASNGFVPLMETLRDKIEAFENQRVGMTHAFYRIIPVTADHQSAAQRVDGIIDATNAYIASRKANNNKWEPDPKEFEPRGGVTVVRENVVDTLAMCEMGLPSVGADNGRARTLIYIGRANLPEDPAQPRQDPQPRIYVKNTVARAAHDANIQVNAIVPGQYSKPIGFVEQLVEDTGGQYLQYTELLNLGDGPPQRHIDNQRAELSSAIDHILAKVPTSELDEHDRAAATPFPWDVPDLLLQLALFAAVALAACRLGMRL